jgi:hypothetical protein
MESSQQEVEISIDKNSSKDNQIRKKMNNLLYEILYKKEKISN